MQHKFLYYMESFRINSAMICLGKRNNGWAESF